jgi:hypothetical protein
MDLPGFVGAPPNTAVTQYTCNTRISGDNQPSR